MISSMVLRCIVTNTPPPLSSTVGTGCPALFGTIWRKFVAKSVGVQLKFVAKSVGVQLKFVAKSVVFCLKFVAKSVYLQMFLKFYLSFVLVYGKENK